MKKKHTQKKRIQRDDFCEEHMLLDFDWFGATEAAANR